MPDVRTVLVPDGLEGERVDAGVARLFGVSRTKAADLAADGDVVLDGKSVVKSERVSAGSMLEVSLPRPEESPSLQIIAEPVPGMSIVHDDDDIVVVDKPVGVAAHPSVGWSGPDVVSGLAAAGYRISTSGAPERQGIVSRLDVGTSGLMVVAKSEYAYSRLKQAFRSRTVDKTYHALVQGLPDPVVGTVDAPIGRHPGHDYKFAVMKSGKPCGHPLRGHRGVPARQPARHPPRDGPDPPDPRALRGVATTPAAVTSPTAPTRPSRHASGSSGSGCTPSGSGSSTPAPGSTSTFESPYPEDLQRALDIVATF